MFECLTHCMRAGLGALLSERSQSAMAKLLAEAATAKAAAEPAVLVCLSEACTLLLTLREVATGARDALLHGERSLMILVEHPARQVRLVACACLWALTVAFPSQLTGLLNATLNRVRTEHAKLAKGGAETGDRLVAHALAAGALVCAIPHTAHGAPYALTTQTIALAAELASAQGVEPAQHSAWLLLRALMRLDLEWLSSKQRLTQLLGLWKGVLGKPVELTGKRGEAEMLTTALPGGGGGPLIFAGLNGTGTAPSKLTPVPSKGPAIAAVELDGCDESDAPQSIGDDKLDVCSCCFGSGLDASAPWEGAATAEFP